MDVRFLTMTHESLYDLQDKISNGSIIVCHDTSRLYVKMKDKLLPMTPPWNKKIQYHARKCVNCGATLQGEGFILKCDYCGTIYDVDTIEEKEI